jgi:threonyl-tRNA synthetase
MTKDSIGREWQVATIQVDFNQPKNFGLVCINEKGEREQVVMIHAAIMGSIERFMSNLIEHLAANFPVWLSPTQVAIVPVSEKQLEYAEKVYAALKEKDVRVVLDAGSDSLGKRIRGAKTQKTPYVIVIGDKEKDSGMLTVETRTEKIEGITLDTFIDRLSKEISEKTLS